jgi:hypothetical protein
MNDLRPIYDEMLEHTSDKVTAALLTLADVIQNKHMIDVASGENFGHELALALKNVFKNSSISTTASVSMEGPIEVSVNVDEMPVVTVENAE